MVITGKLHFVEDAKQVSDSFKRRSFVVDFQENPLYPQYITFELTQERVGVIDAFKIGDSIVGEIASIWEVSDGVFCIKEEDILMVGQTPLPALQ